MDMDNGAQRRRSTIHRLMEQGREEEKQEQAKKDAEASREPLSRYMPREAAVRCRDLAFNMASELPKDASEERMARLRAAKTSTGAVLRDGATVEQAATHAALRTVEQWVRILRPFAVGDLTLAMLISRLVHIDEGSDNFTASEKSDKALVIIPPVEHPFGVAMRRVVPPPAVAVAQPWDFLDDVLQSIKFEDQFDKDSVIHRRVQTSHGSRGAVRQAGGLVLARPQSVPQLDSTQLGSRPDSSARTRLSGDFAWSNFSPSSGFRECQRGVPRITEKHLRRVPGPGVYSDLSKHLSIPQVPGRAHFPSVGDRRTKCIALPLWQFPRFFNQDYSLDR